MPRPDGPPAYLRPVGPEGARPVPPRPRAAPPTFLIVLTAAALIFCAAFFSAPWFAFRAFRDAALNADAPALAELVDFDLLRADLRAQLGPDPAGAPPPNVWQDPVGAIRRAIEPLTPAPPVVDRYLSADGLADLSRGYTPGEAPSEATTPRPAYRYWDFRRARLSVRQHEAQTVFTFRRDKLFTWRLVGVKLPAESLPP